MRFLGNLLTLLAVIAAVVVLIAAPWPLLLGATLLLGAWLLWTRIGRQAASVTGIGVSTLTQRAGASFVIIIGIGGVVAGLVGPLALAGRSHHNPPAPASSAHPRGTRCARSSPHR